MSTGKKTERPQPTPDQLRAIAACLELLAPFTMDHKVEIIGALTTYSGAKDHLMKDVDDGLADLFRELKNAAEVAGKDPSKVPH